MLFLVDIFEFLIQQHMKKILLASVIACFTFTTMTAQSERSVRYDDWLFSIGINTINSLGTKNPFESPSDWAFRVPLMASIESKFFDYFTIEAGISLNGFEENIRLDAAGPPSDDITYFSVDTAIKYYFGEYIFPDTEWIDFYGSAGLGFFLLDDANIAFNFGGGALFWLNRSRTFGLKLQGLGKFAFDHSDRGSVYPNNHFQYSIQAVFKL